MQSITINVSNDKVAEKVTWLLEHFKADGYASQNLLRRYLSADLVTLPIAFRGKAATIFIALGIL